MCLRPQNGLMQPLQIGHHSNRRLQHFCSTLLRHLGGSVRCHVGPPAAYYILITPCVTFVALACRYHAWNTCTTAASYTGTSSQTTFSWVGPLSKIQITIFRNFRFSSHSTTYVDVAFIVCTVCLQSMSSRRLCTQRPCIMLLCL